METRVIKKYPSGTCFCGVVCFETMPLFVCLICIVQEVDKWRTSTKQKVKTLYALEVLPHMNRVTRVQRQIIQFVF